jgi:hypothetical protein
MTSTAVATPMRGPLSGGLLISMVSSVPLYPFSVAYSVAASCRVERSPLRRTSRAPPRAAASATDCTTRLFAYHSPTSTARLAMPMRIGSMMPT